MTHHRFGVLHALTAKVIGGIVFGTIITAASRGQADEPTVWKVEEDWELQINEPEDDTNSPQVTFFITPSVGFDGTYFQLQMNYFADEDYSAGGFHVAAVRADAILDEARSENQSLLSVEGDTIRWTSVAAVVDDTLLFAVKDGDCTSWGEFGGPEYLVRMSALSTDDFSGYSYEQSVSSVDVGFGGNRVNEVRLKRVRLYYSSGDVATVTVPESSGS